MTEATETDKPRRAGRRTKAASTDATPSVTRESIIAHALTIARHENVEAITIMRLSRELGVTPALIHYFTGGRDQLLSGVINQAMASDSARLQSKGDWLKDLEQLVRNTYAFQMTWKGITTYQHANNKHRLFQDPKPGDKDLGLVFFNRFGTVLQSSGMPPERAAMAFHLLMLFTTSIAISHFNAQEPAAHQPFLKGRLQQLDADAYPGANFMLGAFSEITTAASFEEGLQGLLATIASWAPKSDH
jgi:AcrR family transcriptional regulator